MADLPTTAKLGEVEVRLGAPASYTLRQELLELTGKNTARGMAACIVACWREGKGAKRPQITLAQCRDDIAVFGRLCLDALIAAGFKPSDIRAAGALAFAHVSQKHGDGGFWSEAEVAEAEGNSDGETD